MNTSLVSNVTALEIQVADLQKGLEDATGSTSLLWMLLCGVLVMFMQGGFAMLEAGCARDRNVQSVLMKNMIDICVGTMGWFSVGWSFAYVGVDGRFAGGTRQYFGEGIALHGKDDDGNHIIDWKTNDGTFVGWFFQWAFCATAATIVSGGVMERCHFWAYLVYVIVMTTVIYPIIVANIWGGGPIAGIYEGAYIDFAGSGVVHLTGGVGALVGAKILGPRAGRFEKGVDQAEFDPHSMTLVTLGTLILWMGWYGFNCGSTLAFDSKEVANLAGLVAVNTTIAAACAGLMVFVLSSLPRKIVNEDEEEKHEIKLDLGNLCNGVLAGLVSITAGCGNVQPYAAMVIGFIGGIVYLCADWMLKHDKVQIDDPLSAFPVHGACGMWGVIAAALFDFGPGFHTFHGWNGFAVHKHGDPANIPTHVGHALAANLAEICFIWAWSGGISFIVFWGLKKFAKLRVTVEEEYHGLDESHAVVKKAHNYGESSSPRSPGRQSMVFDQIKVQEEMKRTYEFSDHKNETKNKMKVEEEIEFADQAKSTKSKSKN